MELAAYREFTRKLQAKLQRDARVLGLVALGSMAEMNRLPDEWSDHDFFVITAHGEQEDFRQDLGWLPNHERIVLSVRETAHGLKVLYDDAHVLEFAIFDPEELHIARINAYRVLFDRAQVANTVAEIVMQTTRSAEKYDALRGYSLFLSLLLIGSARCVRGEILSGHRFIKDHALANLLALLAACAPAGRAVQGDNLDPFRRFEQVCPNEAERLHTILLLPPLEAARAMLELADQRLRSALPAYPAQAVRVVLQYLEALS